MRKPATLIAIALAALGLATSAGATVTLSPTPTAFLNPLFCNHWGGQVWPMLEMDGANLRYGFTESQWVYVQFAIVNVTNGHVGIDPYYFYGKAVGYDQPYLPEWDHVQNWYYSRDNVGLGDSNPFKYTITEHGTYRVAVRYRWDQSSSGAASSGGWTTWVGEPGECSF